MRVGGGKRLQATLKCCWKRESVVVVNLCLGFKKERALIDHKPGSYDRNYKSSTP
jgi:hypothetical protein